MTVATMDYLEILKYTLPSLVVFFTAYFLVRSMVNKEIQSRKMEIALQNQQTITPLRLQAYERVTLFLERIAPDSLLMRINKPGMTAKQLQTQLLSSIRAEFEHNLSQQIYMTADAWGVVKNAKNNTIKIINSIAEKVKPGAPSLELSKLILEKVMEMESSPSAAALEYLKREVAQINYSGKLKQINASFYELIQLFTPQHVV